MDWNASIVQLTHFEPREGKVSKSMEMRRTRRKWLQTMICIIYLECNHGLKKGKSGIGWWMRAVGQGKPCHPSRRLAMMITAMTMVVMMTEARSMKAKKRLMTRSSKILKN
jgi:hypothetical protein